MNGLRRLGLSIVLLLGALSLGLAAPDAAFAMTDHSGHASMPAAMSDSGAPAAHQSDTHEELIDHADGGCAMGLMGACCVMTCCAATTPEILPNAVRHIVMAARSSRPTVRDGREILPLLEPPKRLL